MFLRILLGLMVLPVFVVAKDAALDEVSGRHCLAGGSAAVHGAATRSGLGDLCLEVDPAGRRTHVGTRLLDQVRSGR